MQQKKRKGARALLASNVALAQTTAQELKQKRDAGSGEEETSLAMGRSMKRLQEGLVLNLASISCLCCIQRRVPSAEPHSHKLYGNPSLPWHPSNPLFGSDFCPLCRDALILEAERKAIVTKDLPQDIEERRLKQVPDSDLPKDRGFFAHAMYNGSLS